MLSMNYNEGVQTNFTFMPRKSSATATPATPRKTRTRKTTTSRRKSASKINTSTAQIKVEDVKEAVKDTYFGGSYNCYKISKDGTW